MKHFGYLLHNTNKIKRQSDERGFVLVMMLMLTAMISALAAAYATAVKTDTILRGAAGQERHGFYAAEAGLNVGMAEFATIFKTYGVPSSSDYTERTVSVGNRTVKYQLAPVPGEGSCTDTSEADCYVTIPAGEKFAGLSSVPYRYTVKATAVNAYGDEEAELGAEFDVHNIPVFQFLAFSTDDLYIMPAPTMDLHGRIHTNGDLYLNVNNGRTLSVSDEPDNGIDFIQVSAADNIYRGGYKDYTGQICTGTVRIDKLADSNGDGSYDPETLSCVGNGSSPVSETTLDSFLGSLEDGVEVIQMPSMDDLARGGDGVYWQNAELRIVLRLDLPRQQIDFGAADLCPNGPLIANTDHPNHAANGNQPRSSQALFPIEVQDEFGNRDVGKTTALWRFMCERRGAIFYTDRPNGAPTPPNNNDDYSNTNANYTPSFPTVQDPGNNLDPIYRRAGEDTNGDGLVNNGDRNDDVCPIADDPLAAAPWWRPSYCDAVYGPWPNTSVKYNGNFPGAGGDWEAGPLNASSWYLDYDYRRGGFYHNREGKWLYMLNVNVRALIDWNEFNSGPLFDPSDRTDWGLVFFLSVQGPESDNAQNGYAVRIFDSADLNTQGGTFAWPAPSDPSGLTVISDQAVFVQGNYNSRHKYPAAIFGDAINVLSQGWEVPLTGSGSDPRDNDRKSATNLSTNRRDVPAQDGYWRNLYNAGGGHQFVCPPSGCTNFNGNNDLFVNAAFISGIGSEGDGVYNGGLENFIRFHESWSSRRLNYLGSFVTLGEPEHQANDWPCGSGNSCNVYDPPERFWDFDPDFTRVENLPPLTPKITYVQQRLYTRFYK